MRVKSKSLLMDLNAEMPTRANQTELLIAWAAGFIDGEGCVSVTESTKSGNRNRQFQAVINASQAKRAPLDRLKEILGGSVGSLRDVYGGCWQWRVYGDNVLRVARLLLPHVAYKKRQLELAIEFQLTKNRNRWEDVPLEIHARREAIYTELRVLNSRRKRLDAERLSEETPRRAKTRKGDAIVRTAVNNEAAEADGNVRLASSVN